MSDDRDMNLNQSETRSEESGSMGDETAAFLKSDNDVSLSGDESDRLAEAETRQGFTIFNTSDLPTGGNEEMEVVAVAEPDAEAEPKKPLRRTKLRSFKQEYRGGAASQSESDNEEEITRLREISARRTGLLLQMQDLNPTNSSPSASSGLDPSAGGRKSKTPAGGDITQGEQYSDVPRSGGGALTHALLRKASQVPPTKEKRGPRKADGLSKPSIDPRSNPPRQSTRPMEQGGVNMVWESEDQERGRESPEDKWKRDWAELGNLGRARLGEVQQHLSALAGIFDAKGELLREDDKFNITHKRESLMESCKDRKSNLLLMLLDRDDWQSLAFSKADLLARTGTQLSADWEELERSKQKSFDESDVHQLMHHASAMLKDLEPELVEAMGEVAVYDLRARHLSLAEGLTRSSGVSIDIGFLFPQAHAGAIMEWYARLVMACHELQVQRDSRRDNLQDVVSFLGDYPGPVPSRVQVPSDRLEDLEYNPRGPGGGGGSGGSRGGSGSRQETVFGMKGGPGRGGSKRGSDFGPDSGSRRNRRRGDEDEDSEGSLPSRRERSERQGGERLSRREEDTVLRQSASNMGYAFRMGSQPPLSEVINHLGPESFSRPSRRSDVEERPAFVRGGSVHSGSYRGGVSGRDDEDSEVETSVAAFPGMTMEEVLEEVGEVVREKLECEGNESTLAWSIIMDNLPKPGVITKPGTESSVTGKFKRAAKSIAPAVDGSFISLKEWLEKLNEACEDNGMSIAMRIKFLARTGGLADDVHDSYQARVKDFMKNHKLWLSEYNTKHDEHDDHYWLYMWVDVAVKFVKEFYSVQPTDQVEAGVRALLKDAKYKFTDPIDPLNKDFYKVIQVYQDVYAFLRERASDLVNSPLYVFNIVKEWINTQGPAGPMIVSYITKALAKLATDPLSVFPTAHQLSKAEILAIKQRGSGSVSEKTYMLILEQLKKRALAKDLEYTLHNLSQLSSLQSQTVVEEKWTTKEKKSTKKVNAVSVSTDYAMALNTNAGGGSSGGGGGGGGGNARTSGKAAQAKAKNASQAPQHAPLSADPLASSLAGPLAGGPPPSALPPSSNSMQPPPPLPTSLAPSLSPGGKGGGKGGKGGRADAASPHKEDETSWLDNEWGDLEKDILSLTAFED